MKFADLPAWSIPVKPDALSLYETVELAGLTDKWIRLTADTQRQIIGFPIFGKQEFRVRSDGIVEVCRSVSFGADASIVECGVGRIIEATEEQKVIRPS